MAQLLDSMEACFGPDFAILTLEQGHAFFDLDAGPYAVSGPGGIRLRAGTKYAQMHVRVERWDAQPPEAEGDWEDRDQLPWQSVEVSRSVRLSGFDPVEGAEMSLEGLDRARVEILAWGRDRYGYSGGPVDDDDSPDEIDAIDERWLLRFWPDPDLRDALAGPARQLIAREWLPLEGSGEIAFRDYASLSEDLHHQVRWAPDGVLRATLRALSERLGVPYESTLGALRYVAAGELEVAPTPDNIDDTTELTVRHRPRRSLTAAQVCA